MIPRLLIVLLLVPVAGCKSDNPMGDLDGGPPIDTGAQPVDEDGDGFPSDEDCDDTDPTIYPGVTRPCESDCDVGIQGCGADGQFSPCTADVDCSCITPGETRLVDCARCGQASQTCQPDLTWSFPENCVGQGECEPGQSEDIACEFCGQGTRLCDATCAWLPTEGCFGSCSAGATETTTAGCPQPYEVQQRECDATCEWTTLTACTSDCLLSPRPDSGGDLFDGDICIPAGPAVIGQDPGGGWGADEEPKHTVELTAFLVDAHEVSVARYRQCVTAGACTEPPPWADYHDPGSDRHAMVEVTWTQASEFCAWDGGRTLPTEAQWEKAARGPAPREVTDPWGSTPADCSLVTISDCEGGWGPYDVDLSPAGNSYYGLYNMAANVREWVADWYDPNYYAVSPTLDPPGPATGTERVTRGVGYLPPVSQYHDTATIRRPFDPQTVDYEVGFRCARPGY